ncbi:2-oxoacid:acceptor oxidoreductase subunit alpha [bacterium]|nr:2-oxoacid:acceptor oxidoreductase subunit alpha [bacterium]
MEKTILIGGQAGQGTAQTSWLLGKALTQCGYFVFNYRDYPSLIRGGHNFNVLSISDKPVFSHRGSYDIIVAFDKNTVDIHQRKLKKEGFILTNNPAIKGKNILFCNTKKALDKIQAPAIIGNDVLAGFLFRIFNLPLSPLLNVAKLQFKKEIISTAIKEGYSLQAEKKFGAFNFKKKAKRNYFLSGNEAISQGAIAGGIDVYIAYPMTPATPVLHYLAKKQLKENILVVQLENEIAVANAALGASYAGSATMVGTSGGGLALMGEAMSLQGMSEVPLVVYLSQRTSPSTGVPTYSTQGDLKFALNIGQGEFPRVVIAPGDARDAFWRTQEAFYLSQKYGVLAIIIGDKHLGESNYTFSDLGKPRIKPRKFILEKLPKDYKSYLLTKSGVSPRGVPGMGGVVRATSYEHNEYGNTIENGFWTKKMNDKRMRKLKFLKEEIEKKLEPVEVYGKGKNLFIGWGSSKGAILDALGNLPGWRFLQISYISPFPSQSVKKEIQKSKRVVLVENNVTGLLGDVIAEQTGIIIKDKILKYDARPFIAEDIEERIKN